MSALVVLGAAGVCGCVLAVGTIIAARAFLSNIDMFAPDFSRLDGVMLSVDVQQAAGAQGTSPRDPALIARTLAQTGLADRARLADGVPAATASRAEWVRNGWRTNLDVEGGRECVTIPPRTTGAPEIIFGPCRPNLSP